MMRSMMLKEEVCMFYVDLDKVFMQYQGKY